MRLFPQGNLTVAFDGVDWLISGNYQGAKVEQRMAFGAYPQLIMFDPDSKQFVPVHAPDVRNTWLLVDFIDAP